jgi:hypothetical protein
MEVIEKTLSVKDCKSTSMRTRTCRAGIQQVFLLLLFCCCSLLLSTIGAISSRSLKLRHAMRERFLGIGVAALGPTAWLSVDGPLPPPNVVSYSIDLRSAHNSTEYASRCVP